MGKRVGCSARGVGRGWGAGVRTLGIGTRDAKIPTCVSDWYFLFAMARTKQGIPM